MRKRIEYRDLAKQALSDGKNHLIMMYAKNHAREYRRQQEEMKKGTASTVPISQ